MIQADDLDRRIIKEMTSPASLQWNIRQSFSTIAKLLKVDEDTIRRRFERMRRAGFFQRWEVIVNPHLIGCEAASLDLTVQEPEAIRKVISQLKLIRGLIYILLFYGGRLRLMTYYSNEEELERQISLMESICETKRSMVWQPVFPLCNLKMTKTDWLIVATLMRNDPRGKLSMVARSIGISSRTLNRRMQRMHEQYAFFLDIALDLSKLSGSACALLVQYKNGSKKRFTDDLIMNTLDNVSWSNTSSPEHSMFSIHCENVSEGERIYQWVRGLDGVSEARLGIHQDKIIVKDWLEEELENRARNG